MCVSTVVFLFTKYTRCLVWLIFLHSISFCEFTLQLTVQEIVCLELGEWDLTGFCWLMQGPIPFLLSHCSCCYDTTFISTRNMRNVLFRCVCWLRKSRSQLFKKHLQQGRILGFSLGWHQVEPKSVRLALNCQLNS